MRNKIKREGSVSAWTPIFDIVVIDGCKTAGYLTLLCGSHRWNSHLYAHDILMTPSVKASIRAPHVFDFQYLFVHVSSLNSIYKELTRTVHEKKQWKIWHSDLDKISIHCSNFCKYFNHYFTNYTCQICSYWGVIITPAKSVVINRLIGKMLPKVLKSSFTIAKR